MSNARNLAKIITGNFNIPVESLGNVPLDSISNDGYIKAKAGATAPLNPLVGQLWTDSTNNIVKSWNGSKWLDCSNLFLGTGGTTTTYTASGITYQVHSFTTSSSIEFSGSGLIDVLVVAGGGGGGTHAAPGGGGAGGLIYKSSLAVNAGVFPIVVGAGGAGTIRAGNVHTSGTRGGDSSFYGLIAKGGGIGCSWDPADNASLRIGGSGGAWGDAGDIPSGVGSATQPTQAGDSGLYGYGNQGGDGWETTPYPGGGGGGAGGAGENYPNSTTAGRGGVGKTYDITGTSATYAGGGCGGGWATVTRNAPQAGGGGIGDCGDASGSGTSGRGFAGYSQGADGVANRGAGGGGAGRTGASPSYGGNGGSGIVVIRYTI